jgi:hypothetical protein
MDELHPNLSTFIDIVMKNYDVALYSTDSRQKYLDFISQSDIDEPTLVSKLHESQSI